MLLTDSQSPGSRGDLSGATAASSAAFARGSLPSKALWLYRARRATTRGPRAAGACGATHGSVPCTPSSAQNTTLSPNVATCRGDDDAGPGLTSCTSRVPAAVPSVTHNSSPTALFATGAK